MQSVICPKCGKEIPFANVVPSQCHHCLTKIKVRDNVTEPEQAEKPDEPQGATTSLVPIKDHSRRSRLGKAVQIREAADHVRQKQELLREERNRKQYPCGACGVLFSEQDIRDKLAVIDDNESLYCPQHVPTLKKCPDCSREVSRNAATCPNCGAPIIDRRSRKRNAPIQFRQTNILMVKTKDPGIAAVLSFLYIGLGQIYNGQIGKGIVMMIVISFVAGLFILYTSGILVFGKLTQMLIVSVVFAVFAFIFWIWNIIDAYSTAQKINASHQKRLRYL